MAGGHAGVAWALTPGGARTPAQAVTGNDFGAWRADVALTGFGAHTIFVWATDAAGNAVAAPTAVPLILISSFVPATLEERLDEREYLAALLSFAQDQVTIDPSTPLDTPTLVADVGQPFDRLSQPLSAAADLGRREINQLRVPVELLRARIAGTHVPTAPGSAERRDTATRPMRRCWPPSEPRTPSCGSPAPPPRMSARHWRRGWESRCRRPTR